MLITAFSSSEQTDLEILTAKRRRKPCRWQLSQYAGMSPAGEGDAMELPSIYKQWLVQTECHLQSW